MLLHDYGFRGGRSPDGRYMCTALPGWALAELKPEAVEDAFVRVVHSGKRMCNSSMSQDPAHPRRFLWTPRRHDRLHYDPDDKDASIAPPPDYGFIQWPEWSTHPDFVTASPSAREDDCTPSQHGAFIYQWSAKTWTQVTRKAYATHLWVEEPEGAPTGPGLAEVRPAGPEGAAAAAAPARRPAETWPSSSKGLLFKWASGKEGAVVRDAAGRPLFQVFYRPEARGLALFDRHHALRLEGGAFVAADIEEALLAAFQKTRCLTLEMVVTPSERNADKAAVLACLASTRKEGNLYLVQKGGELSVVLRTSDGPAGDPVRLCPLPAGRPTHVAITCAPGRLVCYRDGAVVFETDTAIDFGSWRPCPLVLGNPEEGRGGDGGWIGLLEGIALFNRSLTAKEVKANREAYRRRQRARKPVPRVEVEGRLVARSDTPPPLDTVYERGYTMFEYEVVKVLHGRLDAPKFRVAHWAEMENRTLAAAGRRVNGVYRLQLEPFDDNPQMETEQVFDTLEVDLDLPVYYDVGALGFAKQGR